MSNGGILSPGNSIGTLTVNGNFASTGGTYQVEVGPVGQNDRVNVGGIRHHQRRHGEDPDRQRHLRHQPDLHHPERHRRRDRHLFESHRKLRLLDAVAEPTTPTTCS